MNSTRLMYDYNTNLATRLDIDKLPQFDCLCELCDCGCFENSKQPHSLNCKKFLSKSATVASNDLTNYSQISDPTNDLVRKRSAPKGFLSEYQHSFYENPSAYDVNKTNPTKYKDTLSFGNKRLLQEPFLLNNSDENDSVSHHRSEPVRSKTLNRLKNLIPENSSVSWYQSDFNFYGNNNQSNELNGLDKVKKSYNSLDHYKSDYIKRFDEFNNGLIDTYSVTKGGALLMIRNHLNNSNNTPTRQNETEPDINKPKSQTIEHLAYAKYLPSEPRDDQAKFYAPSSISSDDFKSDQSPVRKHDFRPIWIPKKYEGRNMFASHIGSTIFPDKASTDYQTAYNNNFDSTLDQKKTFEKPNYDKIEKSVRYHVTHDNRFVPTLKWQPKETVVVRESNPAVQSVPIKSSYQADFEKPVLNDLKSASIISNKSEQQKPVCKSIAVQLLMQRDKSLAEKYEKQQFATLKEIEKRKNYIDNALANA